MSPTPSPTDSNIFTALRTFLIGILPAGVDVIRAQANRVPQPVGTDFVVMTPLRRERLETNIDSYADVLFTASIAANVMTVSAINFGTIQVGATLFGQALAAGTTTITGQLTGSIGGIGTYSVSLPQIAISQLVAAGLTNYMQPTEVTVQLDVYGPNSANAAQTITTLFRDDFAVQQFQTYGFDVVPLYADDAKQLAFIDESQQYEDRWVVEACLQSNIVVSVAQQFASIVSVTLQEII